MNRKLDKLRREQQKKTIENNSSRNFQLNPVKWKIRKSIEIPGNQNAHTRNNNDKKNMPISKLPKCSDHYLGQRSPLN